MPSQAEHDETAKFNFDTNFEFDILRRPLTFKRWVLR